MSDDRDYSGMSYEDLDAERADLGDLMGSQEDADRAIEAAMNDEYE